MFSFPNFRAWRNALLLFIPAYGAATVVLLFNFWLFLLLFLVSLISGSETNFLFLLILLAILVASSIWYLLIDILYLLFLRLFWSNPPKFLMTPSSFKQKLTHLGVAIAATFFLVVAYVISFSLIYQLEELMKVDYKFICAPDFMLKFSWLWFIAAAYIYHWKYLFEKRN